MTQKIENGSYVQNDDNEFETTDYIDELAQKVLIRLNTQRGKFYPDKNFGSSLCNLCSEDVAAALAFARQAVSDVDGIYIKSCMGNDDGFCFSIIINNKEREVLVPYAHL